jgi:hypothetical protein
MLTLTDPTSKQEVVIAITVLPANLPRPMRRVLVSLGIAGKPPVLLTGTYGELTTLLEAAWGTFVPAPEPATPEPGLLDLF